LDDNASPETTIKTFAIDVNNTAPTLTIANTSINEDATLTVIRGDSDVQASDEGHGIYALSSASTADCSTYGSVAIDSSTGAISFTPTPDAFGSCKIAVSFNDGNILSRNNVVTGEFDVNIININVSPALTHSCSPSAPHDTPY